MVGTFPALAYAMKFAEATLRVGDIIACDVSRNFGHRTRPLGVIEAIELIEGKFTVRVVFIGGERHEFANEMQYLHQASSHAIAEYKMRLLKE